MESQLRRESNCPEMEAILVVIRATRGYCSSAQFTFVFYFSMGNELCMMLSFTCSNNHESQEFESVLMEEFVGAHSLSSERSFLLYESGIMLSGIPDP